MKTLHRLCRVCDHPDYIAARGQRSKIAEGIAAATQGIAAAVSAIAAYNSNKQHVSDEAFVDVALSALEADPTPGPIAKFMAEYRRLLDARIILMQAEITASRAVEQVQRRLVRAGHKP